MKHLFAILIITVFHFSVSGQAKAHYKISSEYCKDNKCNIYVYISSKNYDDANMQRFAQELAVKYKDKEIVTLRVFNDEKIIEGYIKGLREPINIFSDSRAYFIHEAVCGDMLFYRSENDKVKFFKISWKKNEEKCNKPFSVF